MGKEQKIALINCITGKDGSYLNEFLLKKEYIVHGLKKRSSSLNTHRKDHLYEDPHKLNSSKAKLEIVWKVTTSLKDLVKEMIQEDNEISISELLMKGKGVKVNSPMKMPPNHYNHYIHYIH